MSPRARRSGRLLVAIAVALGVNVLLCVGVAHLSAHGRKARPAMTATRVQFAPPPRPKPLRIPDEQPKPTKPPKTVTLRMPSLKAQPQPTPRIRLDLPSFSPAVGTEVAMVAPPPPGAGSFELGDLDHPPTLIRRVRPVYPLGAKRRGVTGMVTVRLLVDVHGRVREVRILKSQPEGVFDDAVISAVRQWVFQPGSLAGETVQTWMELPIRFHLS